MDALYFAANANSPDAAERLHDAWSLAVGPTEAQGEREFAFWMWADAAEERAILTAH